MTPEFDDPGHIEKQELFNISENKDDVSSGKERQNKEQKAIARSRDLIAQHSNRETKAAKVHIPLLPLNEIATIPLPETPRKLSGDIQDP